MENTKRNIRGVFKVKRICEAAVTVSKYSGTYAVKYRNKVYRLH